MNVMRLPFSALLRTLRRPGLLVVLYAVILLLTLPLGLAFRNVVHVAMGDSGAYEGLLSEFQFTVLADFMRQYGSRIVPLLNAVMMFAIFSVPLSALLAGGILTTLGESSKRFSLMQFSYGCARYFGRFIRLLLIFSALFLLLFVLIAALFGSLIVVSMNGPGTEELTIWLAVGGVGTLAVVVLLLMMVADYAKVIVVNTPTSRMLSVAVQATRFVMKNFLRALMLHLTLITIALCFIALYWYLESTIGMVSPVTIFIVGILQQVFIIGRVWFRVAFFAAETGLYQSVVLREAPFIDTPPPPSEPAPLYA